MSVKINCILKLFQSFTRLFLCIFPYGTKWWYDVVLSGLFPLSAEDLYSGRPYGALDSGFNSVDSGDKRWSGNEASACQVTQSRFQSIQQLFLNILFYFLIKSVLPFPHLSLLKAFRRVVRLAFESGRNHQRAKTETRSRKRTWGSSDRVSHHQWHMWDDIYTYEMDSLDYKL